MRFSILTLGCKVNQSESFVMERQLLAAGHSRVELEDCPDICIVNTCTVTAKSDYQSRQLIRRALRAESDVYVTGCFAELEPLHVKKISGRLKIIPNAKKTDYFDTRSGTRGVTFHQSAGRSRFFVKIQDGCDNSCTFCAVRIARGRSRSIDSKKIIETIQEAHTSGSNEVVLTGIHIGAYGRDLTPRATLSDLLRGILIQTKLPRIRLGSLEVNEIGQEMIELLSDKRICRHLHIPLQSADDRILQRMGRKYSVSTFRRVLDHLLNSQPEMNIGSDVIVGFPGEDDAAFDATTDFVSHAGFSYLHVFPYSRREKTPAASFREHLSPLIIKSRAVRLRAISSRLKLLYMMRFIGKTLDTIVESPLGPDWYMSTTGNYLKMRIRSPQLQEGSLLDCHVDDIDRDCLVGSPGTSSETAAAGPKNRCKQEGKHSSLPE